MHHIISDGWSIGVISDELGRHYEAACRRSQVSLPELPLQYADFAIWQREWLAHDALAGELSYWSDRLANRPLLEVPTDRPRPPVQTSRGHIESLLLPTSLTDPLQALAQREAQRFSWSRLPPSRFCCSALHNRTTYMWARWWRAARALNSSRSWGCL